jgi:hypothetical protein
VLEFEWLQVRRDGGQPSASTSSKGGEDSVSDSMTAVMLYKREARVIETAEDTGGKW